MRGRPALRMIRFRPWDPSMVRGVLLALFFLTGALLGYFYARSCHVAEPEALSLYLRDFCAAYDAGSVTVSLASCAVLYLSYTALAFLLGVWRGVDPAFVRGFWLFYHVHHLLLRIGIWPGWGAVGPCSAGSAASLLCALLFCRGGGGLAALHSSGHACSGQGETFRSCFVWEPVFFALCAVCCDFNCWHLLRTVFDAPFVPSGAGDGDLKCFWERREMPLWRI